jgi:hypothetical protein
MAIASDIAAAQGLVLTIRGNKSTLAEPLRYIFRRPVQRTCRPDAQLSRQA